MGNTRKETITIGYLIYYHALSSPSFSCWFIIMLLIGHGFSSRLIDTAADMIAGLSGEPL